MRSVMYAIAASTLCASGVMVVGVAALSEWRRRRRWERELDREFPPGN